MSFQDLLNNTDLIENITSKEDLNKLKEEGYKLRKPIDDILNLIYKKKGQIEKEEYLKNRGIKNFPILKELADIVKNEDALIDIDEYMGNLSRNSYFQYSKIHYILRDNNSINSGKLVEEIINFLLSNNVISPLYEYICPYCGKRLFTFHGKPTQEELNLKLDNEGRQCDNCWRDIEDVDIEDLYMSGFYDLVRKD